MTMRKAQYINFDDDKLVRKFRTFCTYDYSYIPSDKLLKCFKGQKYFIKTHGCQSNLRDGEVLKGLLENIGMVETLSLDEASIIIINTCSVRESAANKVYGEIGEVKHLKEKNKNLIFCITGCMVGDNGCLSYMLDKFPYIDIFVDTHNIHNLLRLFDAYILNKSSIFISTSKKSNELIERLPSKRDSTYKAFVNIAYGCDKFCTYCIVPFTRGRERSRNIEDILNECKELVDQGYQEITLLGQNVDSYGKDLKNGVDFAEILEKVAQLNIPRLRFLTSYPSDFKDNVIDVMSKYKNIMKYLHLPLQSGSNSVLQRMGRRYTKEEYLALVKRIRKKIPDIYLSTDIIVGFPNETYEEFKDTLNICKEVSYSQAFTFIYSPRTGTPAKKLVDEVTYEEKVKRFKELVDVIERDVTKHSEKLLNTIQPVLVDGISKNNKEMLTGITETNKQVHFKGSLDLVGKIVNVKVLENHTYSLIGELIK